MPRALCCPNSEMPTSGRRSGFGLAQVLQEDSGKELLFLVLSNPRTALPFRVQKDMAARISPTNSWRFACSIASESTYKRMLRRYLRRVPWIAPVGCVHTQHDAHLNAAFFDARRHTQSPHALKSDTAICAQRNVGGKMTQNGAYDVVLVRLRLEHCA